MNPREYMRACGVPDGVEVATYVDRVVFSSGRIYERTEAVGSVGIAVAGEDGPRFQRCREVAIRERFDNPSKSVEINNRGAWPKWEATETFDDAIACIARKR